MLPQGVIIKKSAGSREVLPAVLHEYSVEHPSPPAEVVSVAGHPGWGERPQDLLLFSSSHAQKKSGPPW